MLDRQADSDQVIIDAAINHFKYWTNLAVFARIRCFDYVEKIQKDIKALQGRKPPWWNISAAAKSKDSSIIPISVSIEYQNARSAHKRLCKSHPVTSARRVCAGV